VAPISLPGQFFLRPESFERGGVIVTGYHPWLISALSGFSGPSAKAEVA
jgi:hypothetical protein